MPTFDLSPPKRKSTGFDQSLNLNFGDRKYVLKSKYPQETIIIYIIY